MIPLSTIPPNPGVYQFKDSAGTIIYICKAKNLHKRVSSYFNSVEKDAKTMLLVRHIETVDFIIVDSEVEALLLENKLIKAHTPKYNINLKDGKTFAYIGLSVEKFPRIFSTRSVSKRVQLFGPYTDGYARRQLIDLSVRLFKLRVCRTLPKRACLNYHIGLCTAPCIGAVNEGEYGLQVSEARSFLKGDVSRVVTKLQQEMKDASLQQKYEVALEKKRTIDAISHLDEKQKVDLVKQFDQDVVVMESDVGKVVIVLFSISRGVISGKKEFRFDNSIDVFRSFVTMYYSQNYVPHEIIVNVDLGDERGVIEEYLAMFSHRGVCVTLPIRGEKKQLVEMVLKNARMALENVVLRTIQEKLNLPMLPLVIECFDISNLGDQFIVGGMTQWLCGKPNKKEYRRFEVRSIDTQDDFAAMKEVVYRRYVRLRDEGKEMPDLIIIDGGLGQLGVAVGVLKDLGLVIPIIGLAKQEEEIYIPGSSERLRFDINSPMMLLIRSIRDSVHRFVLSYNRKKREISVREEMEWINKTQLTKTQINKEKGEKNK